LLFSIRPTLAKATVHEELFNVLGYLPDEESRAFWKKNFGVMTLAADWNKFVSALEVYEPGGSLSTRLKKDLLMVVDQARTSTVSIHKLGAVLKWAGPISKLTRTLESLISKPYFHPFLSFDDTELLLKNQPIGSYLIRFRLSLPGTFTAAVKTSDSKVRTLHFIFFFSFF